MSHSSSPETGQSGAGASPLDTIDSELEKIEARRLELLKLREEQANNRSQEMEEALIGFRALVGVDNDNQLIRWIKRRGKAQPSKAKRLTPLTVKQMKHVLGKGATIAATASYFKLSEATVNTRKKSFGLVGKNIETVPFAQAMVGMPMK